MRAFLVVALATFLVGCGSEASTAATLETTLKYSRGGGIAGIREDATVKTDGRATFSAREKKHAVTLTRAERSRLARLAEAADVPHAKVPKGSQCCDTFAYRLTYRGHTLRWYDGSESPPKTLSALVGELNRLVEKYGGGLG
jgi:hypothetical protein